VTECWSVCGSKSYLFSFLENFCSVVIACGWSCLLTGSCSITVWSSLTIAFLGDDLCITPQRCFWWLIQFHPVSKVHFQFPAAKHRIFTLCPASSFYLLCKSHYAYMMGPRHHIGWRLHDGAEIHMESALNVVTTLDSLLFSSQPSVAEGVMKLYY
jgi:hypothetical protein